MSHRVTSHPNSQPLADPNPEPCQGCQSSGGTPEAVGCCEGTSGQSLAKIPSATGSEGTAVHQILPRTPPWGVVSNANPHCSQGAQEARIAELMEKQADRLLPVPQYEFRNSTRQPQLLH